MARTSAADYPTLGFDPTPGDLYEVSTLASTLSNVSAAMNEISNVLHGAADGEWRGDAAAAFRDLLDDELRPKIDVSRDAFSEAHRHISNWSTDLESFQRRARTLERSAANAQDRADSAQAALSLLPAAPMPGMPAPQDPAERDQLEEDAESRSTQQQALESASGEVEGFRQDARGLHDDYVSRGGDVAGYLQNSIDIAPAEPGWLDNIAEGLGDFFDAIGDLVLDVLKNMAPILELIGDIAGVLSAVLGLLAFIPGLQFLALPALILAGVALVTHYLSAVGATGSFLEAIKDPDVIMDAIGLALGGGAYKLGKSLTTAARASGNTRMVPQMFGLLGDAEVPYGFFHIAKGTVTTMETPEFLVRTGALHVTWAGFGATGAGAPGSVGFLGDLFSGKVEDVNRPVMAT